MQNMHHNIYPPTRQKNLFAGVQKKTPSTMRCYALRKQCKSQKKTNKAIKGLVTEKQSCVLIANRKCKEKKRKGYVTGTFVKSRNDRVKNFIVPKGHFSY